MRPTLLLSSDLLIDRPLLAASMPAATAQVMSAHFGEAVETWEDAYRHIVDDWESYWRDLDLNQDDSLAQWREGRWRVVRALFRLTSQPLPSRDEMALHLDTLPREVGRHCQAWQAGAVAGVGGLADEGATSAILAPMLPAPLVRGMVDSAGLENAISAVIGPDELGQAGLEGISGEWLAHLAGGEPEQTFYVSRSASAVAGLATIAPPDDLSRLPELLSRLNL